LFARGYIPHCINALNRCPSVLIDLDVPLVVYVAAQFLCQRCAGPMSDREESHGPRDDLTGFEPRPRHGGPVALELDHTLFHQPDVVPFEGNPAGIVTLEGLAVSHQSDPRAPLQKVEGVARRVLPPPDRHDFLSTRFKSIAARTVEDGATVEVVEPRGVRVHIAHTRCQHDPMSHHMAIADANIEVIPSSADRSHFS